MSRIRNGAVPSTISTTLASSPTPKAMNSTGRMASGGIIESARTHGDQKAPNQGKRPFSTPTPKPRTAPTDTPMASRRKLDAVSFQNRYSPLRRSGSKAMRSMAAAIVAMLGSSLSFGFSERRALEASA